MTNTGLPVVKWGPTEVKFIRGPIPDTPDFYAAVVFARYSGKFAVANIPNRGWCIPSGRPEGNETPLQTAIRETMEEIGSDILQINEFGYYEWINADGSRQFVPTYVADVTIPGDIPEGSESLGVRLMDRSDLAQNYWHWDELLEQLFRLAEQFEIKNATP